MIAGDQRLRDGEADGARERVDVGGRARDEVAGPGALDGRERQREHAAHEVLAQLGEDLLREHERGPAREPGEDRLDDEEDREQADDLVHVRRRRAVLHGLDERAEERRSGEAGSRGGRVQADHAEQRPPVAAPEPTRLRAQLVAGRDREQLVHRSSPRVTVQR